jgi:hypothetical protein
MQSIIKLSNSPNQTFTVTIPGDSKNLNLKLTQNYNLIAGYWVLGIYDSDTDDPYIVGLPLLWDGDLLAQYTYMELGSLYVVNKGDLTINVPNDTNIADNFVLVWELD